MGNPITVCVGTMDLKAVHSVTQKIYIIDEEEKTNMVRYSIFTITYFNLVYFLIIILILLVKRIFSRYVFK